MDDAQRLRLYLRDQKRLNVETVFSDADITQLIAETTSIESAAALGWLLKAASAADSPRTLTIGQMSETLGQVTESWKVGMAMHQYWLRKADPTKGTAKWLEQQPADGIIADLQDTIAALEEYWRQNDISRLDPVV